MRILICACVAIGLLQVASPALALSSFQADYDISRGVLTLGVMSRRLTLADDSSYEFESRMETTGLVGLFTNARVIESSSGRFDAGRLHPDHYRYDKNGSKRDFALTFDYPSNTVMRSDRGPDWRAEMPPRLLDKLSYQAQMMIDLAGADSITDLTYAVADKGKIKQYVIANLGNEIVETGLGRFDTIKLQRDSEGSRRRTTVWCAIELGWMPVKVEYRDKDGEVTTAIIRSIDPR